jgi:hypothetical protein
MLYIDFPTVLLIACVKLLSLILARSQLPKSSTSLPV